MKPASTATRTNTERTSGQEPPFLSAFTKPSTTSLVRYTLAAGRTPSTTRRMIQAMVHGLATFHISPSVRGRYGSCASTLRIFSVRIFGAGVMRLMAGHELELTIDLKRGRA